MCVQTCEQFFVIGCRRCRLVDYNNVQIRQQDQMLAKRLPYHSLDAVASCGPSAMLLRDCEPEAGRVLIVLPAKHGEEFVPAPCSLGKHPAERSRIKKPVFFAKPGT